MAAQPLFTPEPRADLVWPQISDWPNAAHHHILIDPATAEPWARLPMASGENIEAAIARARTIADREWTQPDRTKRAQILERLIQAIEDRQEEFAQRISREMGAPIDFARDKQVKAGIAHLQAYQTYAEAPDDICPDPQSPEHRIRYDPLGVAALITPWNWPLNQVVLKVGAALLAGCSMLLKPSEFASTSALLFADCMAEAGADDGRFQLVLGEGSVGETLCAHPDVDVISFTGSTQTGARIAALAAPQFKRLNLELGGKSANILFADCTLPLAVEQGVAHAFRNTGQSCNAASRMLVERDIYDAVCELAAGFAQTTQVAHPSGPGPHLGALVSAKQYHHVREMIRTALGQGARLLAGGLTPPEGISQGYFVQPTILSDVTEEMEIFHKEVFGPVLTLTPFDGEDEAIRLANATSYGLAGYVQTQDAARADRVARRLQAGMVQVNGSSRAAGAPFGGRRASGQGREAGLWGIRAFQDIKSISGALLVGDST